MKIKRDTIQCTDCGQTKAANGDNFFKSYSSIHTTGYVPICKKCCREIFEKYLVKYSDKKIALNHICRNLDKPFIESVSENAIDGTKDDVSKLLGRYFKLVHMQNYINQGICTYADSTLGQFERKTDQAQFIERERVYSKEWNGIYTPTEIEILNEYYKGLHNDFKIVTTNHRDYAKKICQASLAVDKAFQDMFNGVAGAEKKYKDLQTTFDNLSKSAQFSESRRGINDVSLGCFGVLFDKVEQKQWIPVHTPIEKDDYDNIISAFATIRKSV